MSNIIDYPTRFKPGVRWTGNRNGRPKGSGGDLRNAMSKRLAQSHEGDIIDVINRIFKHAQQGEKWALKLIVTSILPYFLGKPKPEIEEEEDEIQHSETFDQLNKLSTAKLLAIQKILEEDTEEPAQQPPI